MTEYLDHCGNVIMFTGTFDIAEQLVNLCACTCYNHSREALVILIIILLTLLCGRDLKNYWTNLPEILGGCRPHIEAVQMLV